MPGLGVGALTELLSGPAPPPDSARATAVRAYCAATAARMAGEAAAAAYTPARVAELLAKARVLGLDSPEAHNAGPLWLDLPWPDDEPGPV